MSRTVIQVEGLGKRYRIGQAKQHNALSQVIGDALRAPIRLLTGGNNHKSGLRSGDARQASGSSANGGSNNIASARSGSPYIWALKDINFDVKEGEVVGLIGRNGAGKSTLLKILARITRPTEGQAEIRGRVGSLLEVGTGFHPELTGRENMFMSAAVLGMRKAEFDRKFDEIVAFSGVERFLDTSLKHYSSGMQMRLAFAVAAHLEPEILLIDEVLAVGDASFQKKCLGKMKQVSQEGRTILFVSHNMAAVKALCSRAILIKDGRVDASGAVTGVVDEYLLGAATDANAREWTDSDSAPGNENVRISYVRILPPEGEATITIDTGAVIEIGFDNSLANINLGCTIYVIGTDGLIIFESGDVLSSDRDSRIGSYHLRGRIPAHLLNAGRYSLNVVFGNDQRYVLFRMDEIVSFDVENTATGRDSNMSVAAGVVRPVLSWSHSFKEASSLVKES
jgi:lipopolysaccharide transport system ATP-binding protein